MALYSYKKQKPRIITPRSSRSAIFPAILLITGLTILGYIGYPYFSFYIAQYFNVDNLSKEFISPQNSFTALADTQSTDNSDYTKNASLNIAKTSEEIKQSEAEFQDLSSIKGTLYLTIDQLGLKRIPITINSNSDAEAQYDPILTHSVAHFKGTSLPGHPGKTFVYGHSSRKLPGGSNFSSIFTDIDKLNLGDEFTVEWDGKIYKYSVYKVKLIDRDDFSIIHGDSRKEINLMTCKPDGVGTRRLIVEAFEESN